MEDGERTLKGVGGNTHQIQAHTQGTHDRNGHSGNTHTHTHGEHTGNTAGNTDLGFDRGEHIVGTHLPPQRTRALNQNFLVRAAFHTSDTLVITNSPKQ